MVLWKSVKIATEGNDGYTVFRDGMLSGWRFCDEEKNDEIEESVLVEC